MERLPARILLSARVTALLGDRRVSGLELADGTELPAETVLVSAGIRPRIELARAAGLAVNRGVVVDSSLRSGDPDIFVAGDLVEFDGIVWGIIPAALDHAPVVAGNLLGREPAAYHQTVPRNTLKVAGVHLTSMGNVLAADPDAAGFTVISRLDEAGERYEKYVVRDGLLAGSILLGSSQNLAFVNQHIGKPVSEEELRARPW
jgi:nitrite reductase (NADH) large subunit